jgi:hypothetical protein
MLSGHLRYNELMQLRAAGIDFFAITFIREPESRIISQYRFMISHKYPFSKSFREKFPRIEEFIADGIPANPLTKLLVGDCHNLESAKIRLQSLFSFIGITESGTAHSNIAQKLLGFKETRPMETLNQTVMSEHTDITVSDAAKNAIFKKCPPGC